MLTIDCRQNIGQPLVVYRSKAQTVSVTGYKLYAFHPFLVILKISEGFMFGLHVPQI